EEASRTAGAMGKPPLFLARAPPRRLDPVRGDPLILELQAKRRRDVEPDVSTLGAKVTGLAAVASDELIRHFAPDLIAAAADGRSDQDVELIRLTPVGEVPRLYPLDGNARQRAAPPGMR